MDRDTRVNLGGFQIRMTKHRLNEADVVSGSEDLRSCGTRSVTHDIGLTFLLG